MRISDWSSDVCSSDLAAGVGNIVAEEDVALDEIAVAVAQHKGALRRQHQIFADDVAARLDRDDLDLAAAMIEDIARSEEHTSELQSLMRISYAVFCLKKKNT